MAYLKYHKLHPSFPLSFKVPLHFVIFINLLLVQCILCPCTNALSFNFPSFGVNQTDITREWDAEFYSSTFYLTKKFGDLHESVGRALYHKSVQLWEVNGSARTLADFTTHFSFQITTVGDTHGHGLAFVLIPEKLKWAGKPKTNGRLLGLFESVDAALNGTGDPVVAIEFDTHGKESKDKYQVWDEPSEEHIGIDVNSIKSMTTTSVPDGIVNRIANVWIAYDSTTKNLSASLTFADQSLISYNVFHIVDLSIVLPQRVRVGFTAATAFLVELNELLSWSFNSSLDDLVLPTPPGEPSPGSKVGLAVGITLCLFVIILVSGVALWFRSRKKSIDTQAHLDENPPQPHLVDDRHVPGKTALFDDLVPKRFSYVELDEATNGFTKELVLGKGGFGDVFEGTLGGNSNEKVAVKRFRSGSTQGETEYVSEINVISRLNHKNLVQLKGWCHENEELLLVYEFMPNRSLDIHLFGNNLPLLTWSKRYNIALGLASALHYLQDGSNPGVVHRDIKSSNIMLDSNFNAKLGDFGLAKLTNHEQSLTPTVIAGTLGYLAPEVIIKGKASKATDTYSYGVVALELASGRKPINQSEKDATKAELVSEWVWDLYKKGLILEAVDNRLNGEYDKDQATRLLVVGLWCCHPDAAHRPSIKQVIAVLNSEAEPEVPLAMPALTYISPLMNMSLTLSSTTKEARGSTSTTTTTTTNNST